MSEPIFILVHSPLVGALTWQAVADDLRQKGYEAETPDLVDRDNLAMPYWQQEVSSIALPASDCILVGHSGAGALLPAIATAENVIGSIYVDAVLLFAQASRLDLLRAEDKDIARLFEGWLNQGGRFPNWTDGHLASTIADDELRRALLADLRPRSKRFFTEPIAPPADWEQKPCAYIQLSSTYAIYANRAEARGWYVLRHDSHHFAMLTEAAIIADLLLEAKAHLPGQE